MGILVNTLYKTFPWLPELERKTETLVKEVKYAYNLGNKITDYVIEKKDYIANEFEKTISSHLSNFKNSIYNLFENLKKGFKRNKKYKAEAEPAVQTKNKNLEHIINTANNKEKKIYSSTKKSYLDSLLENADEKYIRDSAIITKLYNNGYNTYEIVREATRKGYAGINNYNDITGRVAVGINSGLLYTKEKYNNAVATKLGAREQIINDYLAGKSYKEIKENLKKNTNGMSISDSSILRIMHGYENKTGKKVVGKRNGNGKKNKSKKSVKKSKGKSKKK